MTTKPTLGSLRPRLVFPLAALLLVAACGDDKTGTVASNNNDLQAPTVQDLPEVTSKAQLEVGGTRSFNAEVWVEYDGRDQPANLAGGAPTAFWTGQLALEEGENKLTFFSRLAGDESPRTDTYTVILDTTAPAPPVLTDAPDCVQEDTATIVGTVEAGAVLLVDGEPVEVSADGSFSVEIAAGEDGAVALTTQDAAGNESEAVDVAVIAGAPTPTLDDITSPTNENTQTLTGTKSNAVGIVIRSEGQETGLTVVEPSGDDSWSYELDLGPGANTFYVSGITDKGRPSCEELGPFTILFSDVCPAEVTDDFPALTNQATLPVAGTRCQGVSVHWRFEDESLEEARQGVGRGDEAEWTFDLTLEEGVNVFYVHYQNEEGLPGPEAGPFTVELDTTPPAPPTFDPVPPETSVEGRIDLEGGKDEDSNVCLRVNQDPECAEIVNLNAASDWRTTDIDVRVGDNFLCISSADRAGNVSTETCANITGVPNQRPTIFIEEPLDGSAINNEPFRVRATVTDSNGLDMVEICLDNDCADATDIGGDEYERTVTAGDFENGSSHAVIVRAENTFGGTSEESISVNYLFGGVLLSTTSPVQDSLGPKVAVDGSGRVHVIWEDNCAQVESCESLIPNNFPPDIFHRVFNGAWSEITVVSSAVGDDLSSYPDIVADSNGDIHVVWQDTGDIDSNGADADIYHRSYDHETEEWGDFAVVSAGSSAEDANPSLAAGTDGSLYAVWERRTFDFANDRDIYGSVWNGDGWTVPVKISDQEGDAVSGNATVAIDNLGIAYVVWQDAIDENDDGSPDDRDILVRWVDGLEMGPVELVSRHPNDGTHSLLPRVAMSSQNEVHIVWQDNGSNIFRDAGPDYDIVRSRYSTEGFPQNNAYTPITINSMNYSGDAAISINPATDNEFIVWSEENDDRSDSDIYYSHVIFGAPNMPTLVSSGPQFNIGSGAPDTFYDPMSETLHVVWIDEGDVDNSGTDFDIYYLAIALEDF